MQIHESAEDYLEAILMLKEQKGVVRSIDVVNELGYSKPSISVAMKHLRENSYVLMDDEGYLSLTNKGYVIARRVYDRHQVLTKALMALGVSEQNAAADACKVEHDLSEESFDKIREHFLAHEKDLC